MPASPSQPILERRSAWRAVLVVLTVTMAMVVNTGNATAVSISLPTMALEWHLEEAELQWPVAAYPLSSGCLLLAFGRVADLHGRKLTFVTGSIFLTIFTLACGFSNNVITLDILRGIQGIGAAATIPASLGILAHEFKPGRARSLAFATFAAGAPLGGVLGTAIGGVLTQYTAKTWRSSFWLMAGLNAAAALGGILSIAPDSEEFLPEDKRIDWLGSFLVTAGLVLIVFVLSQGEIAPQRWRTNYIIALLVIGVFLIIVFCYWQHYLEKVNDEPNATKSLWTPPPIMKLSLWKRANGKYAAMMIIAFVNWCAFLTWTFWSQLYYQQYLHLHVIDTVVRFLPMFVSGVLCNVLVGTMAARIPVVYLAATGCASLLFALIEPEKSYWAYGFPAAIVSVMGADFVFSAGTLYAAKSLSGAIFNTMTQLGTAVGVTVSTVVFNQVRLTQLEKGEDLLKAYQAANWTGFAFGMIGTVLSILFFHNVGAVGDKKAKPSSEEDTLAMEPTPSDEKRAIL
ncbi:MFS general substrate transporter [Coprinellus micaceus]|uniref:MFS general substrate transporter n=1 Tax=Coprinellus micaceus TaxID=71717 RepID=A0A4Y7TCK6_COPMI|nr:MFS general substrate transporter [Coprinellus micaceus]